MSKITMSEAAGAFRKAVNCVLDPYRRNDDELAGYLAVLKQWQPNIRSFFFGSDDLYKVPPCAQELRTALVEVNADGELHVNMDALRKWADSQPNAGIDPVPYLVMRLYQSANAKP